MVEWEIAGNFWRQFFKLVVSKDIIPSSHDLTTEFYCMLRLSTQGQQLQSLMSLYIHMKCSEYCAFNCGI